MQTEPIQLDLAAIFKEKVDALCARFHSAGLDVTGYEKGDVHLFKSFDPKKQSQVLSDLEKYISVYGEALDKQIRRRDEKKLLWLALSKWGYRAGDDLFDIIEEDDYIEVYNSDNVQVHRSFNYFNLSSFTFEQIFSIPWFELYSRDERRENEIVNIISQIFAGELTQTVYAKITHHLIRETISERRVFDVNHNYFSPLKNSQGGQTAFVVLSKAKQSTQEAFEASREKCN